MPRADWRLNQCKGSKMSADNLLQREVFHSNHALCPVCGRSCVIKRGRLIEHKAKEANEPKGKNPHKQLGAVLTRPSKAKNPTNERPHSSNSKARASKRFVDFTAI